MKVLKAKSEKGNLVYAPKPEPSTTDAATKIFGKRTTEQCQWKLWSSPNADYGASDLEIYKLECLIPKSPCGRRCLLHNRCTKLKARYRLVIDKQHGPILVG